MKKRGFTVTISWEASVTYRVAAEMAREAEKEAWRRFNAAHYPYDGTLIAVCDAKTGDIVDVEPEPEDA